MTGQDRRRIATRTLGNPEGFPSGFLRRPASALTRPDGRGVVKYHLVRPASEAERARLNESFAALCRIPSPFGHEQALAAQLTAELERIGLPVEVDGRGNLLARVPGRADAALLLCAHMDTVEVEGSVEPVLVDGGWENARDAILGADNKAAVAVLLQLARRTTVEGSPLGLELLFTVEE